MRRMEDTELKSAELASGPAKGDAAAMMRLMTRLFPICRSTTGDGVRQTLALIGAHIPLEIHEVPSGTKIFDWEVPQEWNARHAWIETLDGRRIVDFADSNLHLVQYSVPVDRIVPTEELRRHIHTLPAQPDWIPHRTAFYADTWGFAMAHRTLLAMDEPAYRVSIDTTIANGHLTYGEFVLPGSGTEEFLISAHCCQPSLANDNLSGLVVATRLAQRLKALPNRRLTYRFLFAPTTIGSLTWLARNEADLSRIRHGLVLTCVGDGGSVHYKRSRRGNAEIDRFAEHVLRHAGGRFTMLPFEPYGSDERQYCSPGFDLPVGCFMRTPNDGYPEYHTSADDLDLIDPAALVDSLDRLWDIVGIAEGNAVYQSRFPKGEPQLGRRGLYRPIGRGTPHSDSQLTVLWLLNLADGKHSLLDVAERAGRRFDEVRAVADILVESGLIERLDDR